MEALAAGARVGRSGVLVVVGEAGSGKTALLARTEQLLEGMQVCRVLGTEAERDLSFGGLSQLVGSATGDVANLPAPQARALEVALNLRAGRHVDRLAVGAGTLGLLSHRAETRPLAVLVDDAHLLDHSSAEALTFAARRLLADPVLLVVAVRAGLPTPLRTAGLPELELRGLDATAAQRLLAERTGQRVTVARAEQLVRATGGNPLALLELGEHPDGLASLGPADPIAVRAAVARAFLAQTEDLSDDARGALLVAACSAGDPAVVAAACRALGLDPAALTEATDAGLLHATRGLEFRHPLVRAAVVGSAAPARLRAVHGALAAATPGGDPDRVAWHRAAAATGPDDVLSADLAAVAERARSRSAYDVAATALERAAWLATDPEARADRLVEAAECAWIAGQGERALALLDDADVEDVGTTAVRVPPERVARAGHLRGTIAARTGSVAEAVAVYSAAARAVEEHLPDAAAELWADAVNTAFLRADIPFLRSAVVALDRLAPRVTVPRSRVLGSLATGMARTLTGQGGAELIRRSVEHLATSDTLRADPMRAEWLALGPLYLREEGRFRALVSRALADTRQTALGELAHLLWLAALDDATTDRWVRADAEYQESVQLAREAGQTTDLTLALAGLAWLEARLGRETSCLAHAAEAVSLCLDRDIVIGRVWTGLALGELALGAGRAEEALTRFDEVAAILAESGLQDMDLDPRPERVEALVRLGRVAEARGPAQEYHRLSAAKGQAWALARAERSLALVAPDDEADAHFAAAAELHAGTPDRFEAARTALAHGASLRRRRRRRDARGPLRTAVATFEDLGAARRADQAAAELAATGETAQRRGAGPLTTLTAQERQIAELLADGQTTRQAAAVLFLSPKTVEYHLRHVYTKLDVRSRAELATALAER